MSSVDSESAVSRSVKPVPADVVPLLLMPQPKISAFAWVVVTGPLSGAPVSAFVPVATSSVLTPEYSCTDTRRKRTRLELVIVTVLAPLDPVTV